MVIFTKFKEVISYLFALLVGFLFMFTNSSMSFANDSVIDIWDFGAKLQEGSLYKNHITPSDIDNLENLGSNGKTIKPGMLSLDNGNIQVHLKKQERFYYFSPDQIKRGKKSAGNPKKHYTFKNDIYNYTGKGYIYFNGSENQRERYFLIKNINKGDRITVYGFEDNVADSTVHFDYQGELKKDELTQTSSSELGTPFMYEVVAKNSGTYKLWFDSHGGKIRVHRIVRAPAVKIEGKVEFGKLKKEIYKIAFINLETKEKTFTLLDSKGNYNVKLAPGYKYIASISGVTGYGFSNDTKIIDLNIEDSSKTKKIPLKIEVKPIYTLSGKIKGFKNQYNLNNLKIQLTPPKENNIVQPQFISIDENLNYSVILEPNVEYTAKLIGANDYIIESEKTFVSTKNLTKNIKVKEKTLYTVKGNFINLNDKKSTFNISGITFKNLNDNYIYKGYANNNSYKAKLRDGKYEVILESKEFRTLSHITINSKETNKDLMVNTKKDIVKNYPWMENIYVGYKNKTNNFSDIKQAVQAAAGMNIKDEKHRVIIHIAPGVYRQQLLINTPYLTFVNEEPEKGDVLITWYYGIGYKYYSARAFNNSTGPKGYYDKELAYDKFNKSPVDNWGSTVYLKSGAKGFIAENIIFENSFNRYVTKEEIDDGVELAGTSSIKAIRKLNSPVNSEKYKERAAAILIKSDKAEFYKCSFLSNQDTLGTGSARKNTHMYFKNCLIEGGTDYIFGGGNIVFDNCQLNWFGDKDKVLKDQYITAAKADVNGYLFRNATITTSSKTNKGNLNSSGLFGRPWEQKAKVAFINTKFASSKVIEGKGWTSMSSAVPEKANFFESNSTYNDIPVDTTKRRKTKISSSANIKNYNAKDYFGNDWIPVHYVEDSIYTPVFEIEPYITLKNNKVIVNYKFENNNDNSNDASLIQWYRVDQNGNESFIKCNTAYISKSYTITSEDKGYFIKAIIIPEVVSGKKGKIASIQIKQKIK